ncbi:hypothetical protein ACS3SW_03095 [Roseobacteraceae bacterium S113]
MINSVGPASYGVQGKIAQQSRPAASTAPVLASTKAPPAPSSDTGQSTKAPPSGEAVSRALAIFSSLETQRSEMPAIANQSGPAKEAAAEAARVQTAQQTQAQLQAQAQAGYGQMATNQPAQGGDPFDIRA